MIQHHERGQALLLVLVALSVFVIGAVGLAFDGAQIFAHRQMAQAAADSAAQAGIMSIFDGTNSTAANPFGTGNPPASFTCTTADLRSPCVYARNNGFGGSTNDQVTIDFPATSSAPGVSFSSDPLNLIKVAVTRTLDLGLIRFVGPSTSLVKAIAMAAIVDVVAPVPILVTHPTLSGALSSNGNPTVVICGGPARSIQVNSISATSLSMSSNTTIDLHKAGPNDPGNCSSGTGADFGDFGGPSSYPFTFVPGVGKYIQPASPILDPLAGVSPPTRPTVTGGKTALANGVSGCPAAPANPCKLFSPGLYTGGITVKKEAAVFKPGIYYMDGGGFVNQANGIMMMATGFGPDPGTGSGMLVYNTGAGTFDVGSNSAASLVGSDLTSSYKGILFFQDRNAPANTGAPGSGTKAHKFGGGGAVTLVGTIYISNSLAVMNATPAQYQTVQLQGTPGSSTLIQGEIIASSLSLGGNAGIQMDLNAGQNLHIRQVALVK